MRHVLTADLGNSRIKLRLFRPAEEARCVPARLVAGVDLVRAADLDDGLAAWLRGVPAPELAAISSVADPAVVARVRDALAALGADVRVAPDCGLSNRCREPDRVGRDRLYAARAALTHAGGPAIALDCGTALTVDAVAPAQAEDASAGAFLGGAIAPGPALLARALGDGTAQLFSVEPRPDARALGRDTAEALGAGIVHGLRGAAERLAHEVAREAGFEAPALVATGGALGLVLDGGGAPAFAGFERVLRVPDLVHHGLLLAVSIRPPSGDDAERSCAS